MRIEDAAFVVTDTETTGIQAGRDRVIEIAAVKVVGGEIVDRYSQLINPGRSIPRRIAALTGITTGMVYDQPPAEEVFPRYLDFLGDGVFVAHNLGFDARFVNAELDRLGLPAIGNEGLCTLRLARRLLKGLPSKGLAKVAAFYGLSFKGRHRALGDATVTAEILLRFLSSLTASHEMDLLEDLLSFQHRTYTPKKKASRALTRIREEVLPDLPERPGVYFMRDRQGKLLYIGKAKNLRARVRSYFNAIEAHAPHTRQLVQAVRDVHWEETGSELVALLEESRLIKTHKPPFNRAQRRYRTRPFIRLETATPFPKVTWLNYLRDDGAEYFGPMGGRRQAELVVDLINRFYRLRECDATTFARGHRCLYADMGRCEGPCEGGDAADKYADEVQRVRAFLLGKDPTVLSRLEEAMKAAAALKEFEQAGQYRDWRQALERILERQQRVASPVLEHNAVLVLPGVVAGTAQLFLVRFGRHVETVTLPEEPSAAEIAHLKARLALHFNPDVPRPERYMKEEVDEVRVLAHWMYVYRESTQQIFWEETQAVETLLQHVLERLPSAALGEAVEVVEEEAG